MRSLWTVTNVNDVVEDTECDDLPGRGCCGLAGLLRMTLFSSPSYTTMPRNRACLFATDSRSTERTVYLPVPFCLILLFT
jgi:hypothetical protein